MGMTQPRFSRRRLVRNSPDGPLQRSIGPGISPVTYPDCSAWGAWSGDFTCVEDDSAEGGRSYLTTESPTEDPRIWYENTEYEGFYEFEGELWHEEYPGDVQHDIIVFEYFGTHGIAFDDGIITLDSSEGGVIELGDQQPETWLDFQLDWTVDEAAGTGTLTGTYNGNTEQMTFELSNSDDGWDRIAISDEGTDFDPPASEEVRVATNYSVNNEGAI
jgi:hypothetical protein